MNRRSTSNRIFAVLLAFLLLLGGQAAVQADELQDTTSLGFVPANASFYSTGLRCGEQFQKLMSSNAMYKLQNMPAVQQAMGMLNFMLMSSQSGPFSMFQQWKADPQNEELLGLLADMMSHESFVYGSEGFADMFVVFNEINTANTIASVEAGVQGGNQEEVQARAMLTALNRIRDDLHIPTTVVGFKLSDTAPAESQLARLEELAGAVFASQPMLEGRFARTTVGDSEFLTVNLDGSMIPVEEIPIDEIEQTEGEFDELLEKIQELKFTVALGIRGDYLLLSFGETTDHLAETGGPLLYDREEFSALREHADKPITSIDYVSKDFMEAAGSVENQLNAYLDALKNLLPTAPLPEDVIDEILEDAETVRTELPNLVPKPGAMMSFAFMTDRGYEGYAYNWSENKMFDGSQPLTILDHVGRNPVLFYAARGKYAPEDYETFVKVAKRLFYYAEKIGVSQLDEVDRDEYTKVREIMISTAEKWDKTTRENIMPGFKDGQGAIVLDTKLGSNQWFQGIPPADTELPMLELGVVYGISDADAVTAGFQEYFASLQELMNQLHNFKPNDFPPIQIPDPMVEEQGSAKIYYYPLPPFIGLDEQLSPSVGLSSDFAAASLSRSHTGRLLESQPLSVADGPLANRDRPLASAFMYNAAEFIDAITPWVDYGIQLGMSQQQVNAGEPNIKNVALQQGPPGPEEIISQVHTVLEIIKCYRGSSSVTYVEGDVRVTHSESVFEDLPN